MAVVERFSVNPAGRDFVVGDLHGMFALLDRLLARVGFAPAYDRLFSVGDLVDRGPQSPRALEFLGQPWFYAVRGNHEQMLLDWDPADAQTVLQWLVNGGGWWHALDQDRRQAFRAACGGLPLAIELETAAGTLGIVHADAPPALDWPDFVERLEAGEQHAVETALWSRARALGRVAHGVEGLRVLVIGHTPLEHPAWCGNVLLLDTGAVYGNALSLVEAATLALWSEPA